MFRNSGCNRWSLLALLPQSAFEVHQLSTDLGAGFIMEPGMAAHPVIPVLGAYSGLRQEDCCQGLKGNVETRLYDSIANGSY